MKIKKMNTGWRVMPEDEKIKLGQEAKVIGQVLARIRSMWLKEGEALVYKLCVCVCGERVQSAME